ncbi:MAG: PDZ domain-containing protein [Caldilineaceae bacterium SB0675_bin_29]|uniref:PDZ domain-containing protein n=1 Tax=Caldilineaceae bacterium SB0675_bin_29 TaxID=2605266 RepID=A0A6B1FWR4_9CHLR|nr:PDZ domain-containing protein [Caldilineaceae bacterium SB0675_bin_29]
MTTEFRAMADAMAAVVESAGQSVVQVIGRRRIPASGIVWSAEGVIVTANHVVRNEDVKVALPGGDRLDATLIGRDPSIDLAVLRIDRDGLAASPWSPEEELRVGAMVFALGRPGSTIQASLGILSALGEDWRLHGGARISHYVRADLVMYPGFSGGPIVDAAGRVVGMSTSALSRDGGIALTRTTVEPAVEAILKHGAVRRGYLGVGVQTVQLPHALRSELGQETGVLFNSVTPDSPAERGGLVVGDILVNLEDEKILTPEDLAAALRIDWTGKETTLHIIRGGAPHKVSVEIEVREERNQ